MQVRMKTPESIHDDLWAAAETQWSARCYRDAVQRAAVVGFDRLLPTKLGVAKGSSASDPSNAFSEKDPVPGSPRLRFLAFEENTEDWRNAHEGARFLGMGCQKYIRNLTSHDTTELDVGVAMEEIAALSFFARLVTSAAVSKVGSA